MEEDSSESLAKSSGPSPLVLSCGFCGDHGKFESWVQLANHCRGKTHKEKVVGSHPSLLPLSPPP